MHERAVEAFHDLLRATAGDRKKVRDLKAAGRWRDAEPDPVRFKQFTARAAIRVSAKGRESLRGDTLDYQPASFLYEGSLVRRSVAYIEVSVGSVSDFGTGFMISPRLLLTNQHVIADKDAARGALITFDRELDEAGRPRPTTSFTLDPDSFALFSDEMEFDFAVVAVGTRQSGTATLAELGYCAISNAPDKHVLGMSSNIIQHPQGMRKVISVRNNVLVARTPRTLLYETDTQTGSSGSPVFNDDWEVIALHHYGEPSGEVADDQGRPIPTNVNEGIRASAIFVELEKRLDTLAPERRPLLTEALDLGKNAEASTATPTLGPPKAARQAKESFSAPSNPPITKDLSMPIAQPAQSLEVVIPLRISISLDSAAPVAVPQATVGQVALVPAPASVLKRAAESIKVDTNYSDRNGYQGAFLESEEIPLPRMTDARAKDLAPLRAEQPDAALGELRYQNFTVKLDRSKKMAIYTATNVDGPTYLIVDRKTNEVSTPAETERWFEDPRVSSSFFLNQAFYSEWSTYFDRGHLTRRTDPTWGTEEEALRANADTFHFTNCSPQHFRFNQSARYWQGLERYVLEKGAIAPGAKSRLCVFQGPIFDDAIDRMAGDVQIPSSFFKVVVWQGPDGLKSVGLVADQGPLLDEPRRNLGQPKPLAAVDVNQWRVAVPSIEKRTGLDFGADVRKADTFQQEEQPAVGQEALRGVLIKEFADIVL